MNLMPRRHWLTFAIAVFGSSCARDRNTPTVIPAYVDSRACKGCHAQIYQSYQQTGMARSFYQPSDSNLIEDYQRNNRFFHTSSGFHYEMRERDGKFLQRRWETDASGKAQNLFEREVHYVIGSGNHARTYLHWSGGEVIQLPVSWYAEGRRWAMSPGYDHAAQPDMRRRIDYGCLFCHNAYPNLPEGAGRYGVEQTFPRELPLGIDCQRCHGPGSRHIEVAGKTAKAEEIQSAIVNPARLPTDRRMDVCLQCHLETTSEPLPASTRRFGRSVFSFRPGERLSDYAVFFDHGAGREDKFEIAGAGYRFRRSACFLKSRGRLTCTTCHNPHDVPRGDAAVTHYREKCRQCHSQVAGSVHVAPSDCVSCHMPKRRTDDAVHVVMTDHWIQRRRPARDLVARHAEKHQVYRGSVTLYYPADLVGRDRDLYLGIAHVADGADRQAGSAILNRAIGDAPAKALAILADAYMAGSNQARAVSLYRRALELEPAMEKVHLNYALALPAEQAVAEYERLIRANPSLAQAHYGLANALTRIGQPDRAIQSFWDAIRQRPDYAEAYSNLGGLLAERERTEEARRAVEEALRIDPRLASARNNLAKILAAEGRLGAALEHLRRAIATDPSHVEGRLNLGRVLDQLGRKSDALAEFTRVVREAPGLVEGHLSLGIALGHKGDLNGAIAQFREVLRLRPGHPEAARNLELALEMKRP